MTRENIEKLKLAIGKLCLWDKALSAEENQKIINEGGELLKEVASTKDDDVLRAMLDVFLKENEDVALENGVCENLENEIYKNFDYNQILSVLRQKFDSLIINNVSRTVYISEFILSAGLFEDFRKMFNTIKSKKSPEFLGKFYKLYPEFEKKLFILYKDMKSW
jgi:hypothetical protein